MSFLSYSRMQSTLLIKTRKSSGNIKFSFDRQNHQISIVDNGIGIGKKEISKILRPSVSYKDMDDSLRGEKGVGLSFLLFSTNHLLVESVSNGFRIKGLITGAFDWVTKVTDEVPHLELTVEETIQTESFTKFTLTGVFSIQEGLDIFDHNIGKLVYTIRTRTAAGHTGILFGTVPDKPIDIKLVYTDEHANVENRDVPYSFDSPQNYISPNLSFSGRRELLADKKESQAKGKAVYNFGDYVSTAGRNLKFYYFVCSRSKYTEMSRMILGEEDRDLVRGGIYLSTKSMPTGVTVPAPSIGKEGYWSNLFIVFEYDDLRLDMGRKSVPPRTSQMIKLQGEKVYNEIKNHFGDILDTDYEIEEELLASQEIDSMWDHLQTNVNNLNVSYLTYQKEPEQEQGVVAIFHELLGKGKLSGYQTWRNSSRDTYDAFLKYKKGEKLHKIIAEFKLEGSSVIDDILEDKKEYAKIQLLICWDINKARFTQQGFSIREYGKDDKPFFHGATHEIRIPQIGSPLEVIALRPFLSRK